MAFDFFSRQTMDKETRAVLQESLLERSPVFLTTENYQHKGTFLDMEENSFYISHSLTRDEVFAFLRGRKLKLQLSAGGQLYEGSTQLQGLGLRGDQPALRLEWPKKLIVNDPRKAIRLSTIGYSTSVSFSSDEQNIFTGRLIDISMTGAGIRPDPKYNMEQIHLERDISIYTDMRLEQGWSLSTVSLVKNYDNYKIGIEFGPLDKKTKKHLFKYIQQKRKQDAINKHTSPPPLQTQKSQRKEKSKPCILIFGQNEAYIDMLIRSLKTRFEIVQYPFKLSEVRHKVHLEKPTACLFEVQAQNRETYRHLKKLGAMLQGTVPCMFYTSSIPEEHINLFFPEPSQKKAIIDLKDHQTLKTYLKINNFIKEFS